MPDRKELKVLKIHKDSQLQGLQCKVTWLSVSGPAVKHRFMVVATCAGDCGPHGRRDKEKGRCQEQDTPKEQDDPSEHLAKSHILKFPEWHTSWHL